MAQWISETRGIELRAVPGDSSQNSFEGLACKYGVVDSYGTVFVPNCFTRGGLDDRVYSLLWMHDPSRPVGTFRAEERPDGLYIVGKWDTNTAGQEARASALSGSAADLSVGFAWLKDEDAPEDHITAARLMEVSQVTSRFGAVPGSVLTAVRAAAAAGEARAGRVLSVRNEESLRTAADLLNQVLSQVGAEETEGERWGTEYHNSTEYTLQGTPEAEEYEKALEAPLEPQAAPVEEITPEADENASTGLLEPSTGILETNDEEEAAKTKKKRASDLVRLARYLNIL